MRFSLLSRELVQLILVRVWRVHDRRGGFVSLGYAPLDELLNEEGSGPSEYMHTIKKPSHSDGFY